VQLIGEQIPESYLLMMMVVLSMDAFGSIPFAYLRYKQRPVKFAALKMLFIILYIGFCCFFLVACPAIYKCYPELIDWFYRTDFQVGYVLLSNLMATFIQFCCLLPELWGFRYTFDKVLFGKMLRFSLPLLVLGIAGTLSQTVDKIIFPWVYPDQEEAMNQLGIYGACFKIAVVMVMFTQAFRYAYEPFIFAKNSNKDHKMLYAEAMKYFIIFGLLIFLTVIFYMDLLKFFVPSKYHDGLAVIPVVMTGELFFGIYFNLSLWYKVTDKTYWGAIFSVAGSILIIAINVLFIPKFGYMACAWASFTGYLLIMLGSYFVGQRQYKIKYDLPSFFLYMGLAATLYMTSLYVHIENLTLRLLFRTGLLIIYAGVLLKRDLQSINIGKYFHR
jgi:O-antigen/teichoic acid export membrane protein